MEARELPMLTANQGKILVRVHAAAVTPTELSWYPTTHTKDGKSRKNPIPGHEFSGVVVEAGAGSEGFQAGDAVYGMNDWFVDGAMAEYCQTESAFIARKPANLGYALAASVPISALTAWQGLVVRARVRAGERVLVHGGAGAVGLYAIQLARRAGAQVLATASQRDADFLHQLGVEAVIDYKRERFEERVGKVDVIFDTVGGETLERSWAVVRSAQRVVTIATVSEGESDERTKAAFFIVEPNGSQLAEIAALLEAGELTASFAAVVPLANAPSAYRGEVPRMSGRGKVVVAVIE